MARRRGSYSPFSKGQVVTLKDGREGRIVAQTEARYILEIEIEGVRETLTWDDVEREDPKPHFTYEQWQGLGNVPGMGPGGR